MGIISSKTSSKARETTNEKDNELLLEECQLNRVEKNILVECADRELPITDAEKLLHIYKKEQEFGHIAANSNKKDAIKHKPRQQYKTSDYHECEKRALVPSSSDDMKISSSSNGEAVFIFDNRIDFSNAEPLKTNTRTLSMTTQVSPKTQMSPVLGNDVSGFSNSGTINNLLTHNFSNLLEKRRDDTDGPLKPIFHGKLGVEKNKIRSQLEQQGILISDTLSATAGHCVDPKQQGIIGELREVGIIQKVTASENGYQMSSGSPIRRPPPRLTQLPPMETETSNISKLRDLLVDDDTSIEVVATANTDGETKFEFCGELNNEKIDEARKLKLKMLDMEML